MPFTKLTGIFGSVWKLGLAGNSIKHHTDGIEISNNAGDTTKNLVVARPQGSNKDSHAAAFADVRERSILLEFSFAGASPPTPGDFTGKYGLCHTSDGSYNAGEVYYDSGTAITKITIYKMMQVCTALAISGTVSMIEDGIYQAEAGTAPFSWTLKGDGTAASTGLEKVIKVGVTATAGNFDSTTSIPSGAYITRVATKVTTGYDGSATIAVTINGSSPLTVQTTSENAPATADTYETGNYEAIGASETGVVRVVLGGSPTTGAALVFVHYVTPLA